MRINSSLNRDIRAHSPAPESTTAATHEVVSECERLGFLNLPEIQVGSESVH